jgi:hypothetical protein
MLTALVARLATHGLNLVGTARPEVYDAAVPPSHALGTLVPEARTAIVIGNGGGAFWHGFRTFCDAHPGWEGQPDPLDAYTRRIVEEVAAPFVGALAGPFRFLYPFRFPEDPISFMRLADCAGLGRPSLVGVLVHPTYGPWIALRAAILVAESFTLPRATDGFDPCPTCTERACIAACPANAVTARGWDIPACAESRARPDDPCATRCHARFECVIGRAHRYPADALAHHHGRARPVLAAFRRRP